jgi:hypothetical protein
MDCVVSFSAEAEEAKESGQMTPDHYKSATKRNFRCTGGRPGCLPNATRCLD